MPIGAPELAEAGGASRPETIASPPHDSITPRIPRANRRARAPSLRIPMSPSQVFALLRAPMYGACAERIDHPDGLRQRYRRNFPVTFEAGIPVPLRVR